jgi:hypothetical protein
MNQAQQLFVIGPARSGTTYLMAQLNRSDDIYLFSELNSFFLEYPENKKKTQNGFNFAEKFNLRKENEGNKRQKGAFIPNASHVRSVNDLYATLGRHYRICGEKVALGSFTVDGKHISERLYQVQTSRYFNAYHLMILRDPIATLDSMSQLFSDIPLRMHFEGLLSSYRILFDLCWVLPRSRLVLYERLGEDVFSTIFDWLGVKWTNVDRITFKAPIRPDYSFRRAELRRELPILERLESLYNRLAKFTCDSSLWFRREKGQFVSDPDYEFISSGFRALQTENRYAKIRCPSTRSSEMIGRPANPRRVILQTEHPGVVDSVDHIHPLGTKQDHFPSNAFTKKLSDLYAGQSLAVMDLGCAGGGFVKNINDAGHLGVGLEGSDYSLRRKRAEWATIPDRLFICDCTKPFVVSFEDTAKSVPILFDVVTAWAFLENIKVDDLAAVFRNIADHLNPNTGLFIASVHLRGCLIDGHQYHATVRPEWWWRDEFRKNGFFIIDRALDHFEEEWVRGPKDGQNALGTCHVVASLRPDNTIVRRIDRSTCGRFEHANIGMIELKRIADNSLAKISTLEDEVEKLSLLFTRQEAPFSALSIRVLTAHTIERCRLTQWERIAFFGAGSHTAMLLPIWKKLHGPAVEAIIVSKKCGDDSFFGIPIIETGQLLPAGVQAIIPSSHQFEREMKTMAMDAYPNIPWVFFWLPEEFENPMKASK